MSKKEKAAGRKARRERRAKRNAIAHKLTNNLIAKELRLSRFATRHSSKSITIPSDERRVIAHEAGRSYPLRSRGTAVRVSPRHTHLGRERPVQLVSYRTSIEATHPAV